MYRYLLAIAILCLNGAAFAQPSSNLLMERMTSYEIRDAIAAGNTTVILPSGGTEQNGPGMAIGKHNFRALANAQTIAHRLGNALVAPVIVYTPEGRYDPPEGHLRYPGTMGVPEDVYAGVVEGVVRSLKLHGFHDIVLIGDHGSDQAGQDAVAAKLNKEWASTNVRVHAIGAYYRGDPAGDAAEMMKRGIKKEEIGNHADVRDTSQMLAVDPAMVHMNRLEAGNGKNGVEGDPRHATAEIGKVLIERTNARTTELIRKSIAAAHAN
ncbi:MAG TPA: creatininase family protein [Rhizomicrobium sp.]|nr:creatininase family protein [Rhizomicrobium sp.]